MDIYGCQSHVKKISEFLENLSKSDTNFYYKTKKRLIEISEEMLHSVDIISSMLEEGALSQDNEFSSNSEVADISGLRCAAERINSKVGELVTFVGSDESKQQSESEPVKDKIDTKSRKHIVSVIGSQLKPLAEQEYDYQLVGTCAKLISKWWNVRFVLNTSGFYYKPKSITKDISDIVIAFGYHLKVGDINNFISEFDGWLNNLAKGIPNKFSVPKSIHNLEVEKGAEMISKQSIMIWEELLEYIPTLCTDRVLSENKMNLSRYTISDRFEQLDDTCDLYYDEDDYILLGKAVKL